MVAVSVHGVTRGSILPLMLAGLFAWAGAACGGSANLSASAKVNDEGVDANAQYGEGEDGDDWAGDDETGRRGKGPREKKGRDVEDHAWEHQPMGMKATLPGFEVFRDGTSRVFLEVSGNVAVKETETDSLLTYRFQGVRVPERVNTLSLPTQHFSTPVSLVELRSADGDAELVVHLREKARPKVHLKRTEMGTVLSLDFPRWQAPRREERQVYTGEQRGVLKPGAIRD